MWNIFQNTKLLFSQGWDWRLNKVSVSHGTKTDRTLRHSSETSLDTCKVLIFLAENENRWRGELFELKLFVSRKKTSFKQWKNLDLLLRYFDWPQQKCLLKLGEFKLRSIRASRWMWEVHYIFDKFLQCPIFKSISKEEL